jgi:hypothetical protein
VINPVPTGPSAEELRARAEAKDLAEATLYAWDKGAKAYHNDDMTGAIRYFREALSYDPDNSELKHNLDVAQGRQAQELAAAQAQAEALRKANEGLAARQAVAMAAQAPGLAAGDARSGSDAARNGFDRDRLRNAGGVAVSSKIASPHGDPVVPPEKRTPRITALEERRGRDRHEIAAINAELKTLDPAKAPVEVAKLKQKKTTAEHDVHYVNLSIEDSIAPPKAAPPGKS